MSSALREQPVDTRRNIGYNGIKDKGGGGIEQRYIEQNPQATGLTREEIENPQ